MLGVRMRAGPRDRPSSPRRAAAAVPQLAGWGLVERREAEDGRVVLTQRGRLMADAVVRELLADRRLGLTSVEWRVHGEWRDIPPLNAKMRHHRPGGRDRRRG